MKLKLSDLKENEAVFITNKREAKSILELTKINTKFEDLIKNYVIKNGGRFWWVTHISKHQLVLPASDFIKPKKSKLKKVWQEIARMYDRIADLESDKTKPDLVLGLECEPKELTELPYKWCVEVTEENHTILTDWKIKISDGEFNDTAKDYKFIRNNGEGFTEEESDYSIISFSDFERLVLNKPKEIIQEKEIDWGVPQLVENEHGTVWYLIEENKGNKEYFVGICLLLNGVKQFRYSEEIFKTNIKPFNGSITLKNE